MFKGAAIIHAFNPGDPAITSLIQKTISDWVGYTKLSRQLFSSDTLLPLWVSGYSQAVPRLYSQSDYEK